MASATPIPIPGPEVQAGWRIAWFHQQPSRSGQHFAPERFAFGKFDPAYLTEIVFLAEALPAMGYKTYKLAPCARWPRFAKASKATRLQVENSFYKVQIDQRSGALISLYDKELGRELIDTSAAHPFAQMVVRTSELGQEQPVTINNVTHQRKWASFHHPEEERRGPRLPAVDAGNYLVS